LVYQTFSITTEQPISLSLIPAVISLAIAVVAIISVYFTLPYLKNALGSYDNIRQELDQYQLAFEHHPQPIVIKDKQSVYISVNPAFSNFLGKSDENLKGKSDQDFFPRPIYTNTRQSEMDVIETGMPKSQDEELIGELGARWLHVQRTAMIDKFGATRGVLVTAYDVDQYLKEKKSLNVINDRMETLQNAMLRVNNHFDLNELYNQIMVEAARLVGVSSAALFTLDSKTANLKFKVGLGKIEQETGLNVQIGEGLAGKVWQSSQKLVVNDLINWPGESQWMKETGFHAAVGYPLWVDAQMVGVLCFYHDQAGMQFNDLDIQVLDRFIDFCQKTLYQNMQSQAKETANKMQKKEIESLLFRQRLEHFVSVLSTRLITTPVATLEVTFERALKTIAEFTHADQANIVLFENDGTELRSIVNWKSENLPHSKNPFQDLTEPGITWWLEKLYRLETIFLPRLTELPAEAFDTAKFFQQKNIRSFMAVPLVSKRSVVGFWSLQAASLEFDWSSETLTVLKTCGEMFINALERKWAAERLEEINRIASERISSLEQSNRENSMLAELADLLQSCRTADEAYPIISRYAQELLPIGSGILFLIRNPEDHAERIAVWGKEGSLLGEQEMLPNECWGVRRGKPHLVLDPVVGPLCGHLREPFDESYLCAPLIAQGESIGLLHVSCKPTEEAGGCELEKYENLAVLLAEHIAPALANLNLRDNLRSQAIRDPLTGLFNRRYMEETLERELRRAGRHRTSVGVVMFDVDQLKPINDRYGHDAGDTLLKALGNLMMRLFRGEDVASRFGGDEFTVVMPEASLSDVWQRAEQLRDSIKKLHIEHEGKKLSPVTVSLGVAAYPDHGNSTERLLQASDAAAYMAKSEGGDRVMVARVTDEME